MLAVGVALTLVVLVLYVVSIRQYREWQQARYLWTLLAGVALDWTASQYMPVASSASFHAIIGWIGLGMMTLLGFAATWELLFWDPNDSTWGDRVVCKLGYPALAIWLIAFVAGIVAGVTHAPTS